MKKQGREQVEALEVLKPNTQKLAIKDAIPENTLTAEAKNELNNNKLITKNLVYKQMSIHIALKFFDQ